MTTETIREILTMPPCFSNVTLGRKRSGIASIRVGNPSELAAAFPIRTHNAPLLALGSTYEQDQAVDQNSS